MDEDCNLNGEEDCSLMDEEDCSFEFNYIFVVVVDYNLKDVDYNLDVVDYILKIEWKVTLIESFDESSILKQIK